MSVHPAKPVDDEIHPGAVSKGVNDGYMFNDDVKEEDDESPAKCFASGDLIPADKADRGSDSSADEEHENAYFRSRQKAGKFLRSDSESDSSDVQRFDAGRLSEETSSPVDAGFDAPVSSASRRSSSSSLAEPDMGRSGQDLTEPTGSIDEPVPMSASLVPEDFETPGSSLNNDDDVKEDNWDGLESPEASSPSTSKPRKLRQEVASSSNEEDELSTVAGGDEQHAASTGNVVLSDVNSYCSNGTSPKYKSSESTIYEEEVVASEHQADTTGELILSDSDGEEHKKEVGKLIADIFGETDEENAEKSNEDEDEEEQDAGQEQAKSHVDDVETEPEKKNEEGIGSLQNDKEEFVSDFDQMMARRREENRRRYRKRKDYEIINDSDDKINELIDMMRSAVKKDHMAHLKRKPGVQKRRLLPYVVAQLKKSDLQSAFIELGVVGVIADWLKLLPDKSLPALEVRTELLKVLELFPTLDHQILRSSNIGKIVMVLFKHPKETKENREWARPIFNLPSDYRSLSREERMQRDYAEMPLSKKRHMHISEMEENFVKESEGDVEGEDNKKPLRPGDKGWIGRARVPRPSTKDYVIRPKWNVEQEFRKGSAKKSSLFDRRIREIKERMKPKKSLHAVTIPQRSRVTDF